MLNMNVSTILHRRYLLCSLLESHSVDLLGVHSTICVDLHLKKQSLLHPISLQSLTASLQI